ncbi:MAG TPA: hypothetical protein VFA37_01200 [Gaiellaceae bacterium]|nr:hypothetical protein [Gaiellaceae bacterium]
MSSAVASFRGRLRGRRESYAVCREDGFVFRPLYTGGRCPLCGEEAIDDGSGRLPLLVRFDRFRLGLAMLVLASLAMCILVLVMYFQSSS